MSADDLGNKRGAARGGSRNEIPHTFREFDVELNQLRSEVIAMADAALQNAEDAMKGLLEGNRERCNQVIAEDETVDQFEKAISETGMLIMLRFRPVATDLRRVLCSMNMSRMLERIGDHAVNIARSARKVLKTGLVEEVKMLEPLFTLALGEARDAITAYADDNEELALQLEARDKELDRLHKRLTKSLTNLIEERQEGGSSLVHLLFVSRSLERIGDLAVNIGEEVVFIELAEDIRHEHPYVD